MTTPTHTRAPRPQCAWSDLPLELRQRVYRRIGPVDQMALACADHDLWTATFPAPEQVFPLVHQHRLLPEAALLGPKRLRAFLQIPAHLVTAPSGQAVLAVAGAAMLVSDGSVWIRSRRRSRRVDLGRRRAVAVAGGGPHFTAVLCADGALLLDKPQLLPVVVRMPDRVVHVAGDHTCLYALTESRQLFGWHVGRRSEVLLLGVDSFGPHMSPALARDARDIPVPVSQVAVGVDKDSAIHGVYATDAACLRLWGCGAAVRRDPFYDLPMMFRMMHNGMPMHVQLTRLPDPPAAVRHLLVAGRGTHVRVVPEEGGEAVSSGHTWINPHIIEGHGNPEEIGPVALLVDGTLWSPVRAQQLQLDRKVLGMAPAVPGMAVHGSGVRLLLDGGEVVTVRMELMTGLLIVGGPWDPP